MCEICSSALLNFNRRLLWLLSIILWSSPISLTPAVLISVRLGLLHSLSLLLSSSRRHLQRNALYLHLRSDSQNSVWDDCMATWAGTDKGTDTVLYCSSKHSEATEWMKAGQWITLESLNMNGWSEQQMKNKPHFRKQMHIQYIVKVTWVKHYKMVLMILRDIIDRIL